MIGNFVESIRQTAMFLRPGSGGRLTPRGVGSRILVQRHRTSEGAGPRYTRRDELSQRDSLAAPIAAGADAGIG